MPQSFGAVQFNQLPVPDEWRTITMGSDVTLPDTCCCIFIGGTGNLTVRTIHADADVVFTALPVGTVLWGRFKTIRNAGTTSTLMLAGLML